MKNLQELSFMPAAEMARHIKRKDFAPSEVLEFFIDRIESRNPSLNALVYTNYEDARKRAKELDALLMKGQAEGVFFGVPTAGKDFHPCVPGWPSSFGGIKALSHLIDPVRSSYTRALMDSNAVMLGKTNSPAFAFRGTCDNYLYGPTNNPFKMGHNSGGSSGGGAAAVADGLLPIAEGSDGGGSIRIPAAWTNLYGYKASVGTIPMSPRPNAFACSHPFCFDGAMTRTVEDAALSLQEMAMFSPGDPFSLDWSHITYKDALNESVKGWKIGFTPDFGTFPVDPEIVEMVKKAAYRFEEAGAIVEPIEFNLPHTHFEYAECWCRMISISGGLEMVEGFKEQGIDLLKDHRDDMAPELIYWIEEVYKEGYLDYMRDDILRTEVYDALQNAFETYDIILSPVNACHPVKNDPNWNTVGPTLINGEKVEPLIGWCLTFFCNFTGHPAASIPAGISKDGFPVGMQIIGRRFKDYDVLAASAEFERIQPWDQHYAITQNRSLK